MGYISHDLETSYMSVAGASKLQGKPSQTLTLSTNVGALIIRIGFKGLLIINKVEFTPKPYSNY